MKVNSKTYCNSISSILVSSILATSNLIAMQYAFADEYFNPALLDLSSPEQAPVDLSAFESVGGQNEGAYLVDIYVNEKKVDSRNVDFKFQKDANGREILRPCISVSELASWGVLVNKYPGLSKMVTPVLIYKVFLKQVVTFDLINYNWF